MPARGKKLLKARRRAENKHARLHIRRDDRVQVIAGSEKGKIGRVLRVLRARRRIVVEGVNVGFKHVRKSQQNPQGGRVERESPIDVSNVLLLNEESNKGERTRAQNAPAGQKGPSRRGKTRVFASVARGGK